MALCPLLSGEFTAAVRTKGDRYAADGLVAILTGTSDAVDATVSGSDEYHVRLLRRSDGNVRIDATCTCAFFLDRFEPCKHLWAALSVADGHGYLAGVPGSETITASLDLVYPDASFDDDDAPVSTRMDEYWGRRRLAGRSIGASAAFLAALSSLPAAVSPLSAFRHAGEELLYIFDLITTLEDGDLALNVCARKRKHNGEWGKSRPASIAAVDLHLAPEPDREILSRLVGAAAAVAHAPWAHHESPAIAGTSVFTLRPALLHTLVPLIAATGRAYIQHEDEDPATPLSWDDGPPWNFRVRISQTEHAFTVDGWFERPDERLAIDEPVLVLSHGLLFTNTSIARVEISTEFFLVEALRTSGTIEIPERDATRLAEGLARAGVSPDDVPSDLRIEIAEIVPRPRLHLHRSRTSARQRLRASITFDYDGLTLPVGGASAVFDPTQRRLVRRDMAAEDAAMARLPEAGFTPHYDKTARETVWELSSQQLSPVVSALLAEGWHVDADGRTFRTPGTINMAVTSGIDWFDLHATVEFGNDRVNLSDILAALKRRESSVRLGDGSFGLLPDEWLRRYGPLAATGEVIDDGLRFKPSQAALLDVLLSAQAAHATIVLDETFSRAKQQLARFDRVEPVDPPASFQGTLRGYQREGLGWLRFLNQFGFGGCLADDMGLGKTVMVLALLAWRRETSQEAGEASRPSLIVVPRSLVANWQAEAARFAPTLRVLDYSHARRGDAEADVSHHDVVLSTYGTLRRDVARLKDVDFDYVILDEAQAIKNSSTASAKAARLLRARHRLALSGTPIENHLGELWSLFEFLNPGLLGASSAFEGVAGALQPDAGALAAISRGIRPFILRRTKSQVAADLPARFEQTIVCELDTKQRALYDGLRAQYRRSILDRVDRTGLGKSQMHILEALLRLRQAACHSSLVDKTQLDGESAKFDVLVPRLAEIALEGHKALVFSQFTSLLALLRTRLDQDGVIYEYLDGATRDRASHVERFQNDPGCPLFLISLKAGGLGLNLTAADYVFLLDPWWNPATEAQAIDRAHRIGQTREVFAYRLIAKDTIEEKVLELQRAKRALADAILQADSGGLRHISREDLELLLS